MNTRKAIADHAIASALRALADTIQACGGSLTEITVQVPTNTVPFAPLYLSDRNHYIRVVRLPRNREDALDLVTCITPLDPPIHTWITDSLFPTGVATTRCRAKP